MPRVALTVEQKVDYKLLDFKIWVVGQMKRNHMTQTDIGKALNLSQAQICQKLKVPDKIRGIRLNRILSAMDRHLFCAICLVLQMKKRYGC